MDTGQPPVEEPGVKGRGGTVELKDQERNGAAGRSHPTDDKCLSFLRSHIELWMPPSGWLILGIFEVAFLVGMFWCFMCFLYCILCIQLLDCQSSASSLWCSAGGLAKREQHTLRHVH